MEGIDEHKTIPNMKNMIICSIAVLSAALLAACTETTRIWPEEGESKAYVEVSSQKVIFDADGGNAVITVATNADGWDYAAEGDWFTVARQDGNALLVETLINAGAETLTGKLTVSAEKNGETVSQEVALVQRAERSVNLSAEGTANCYIARTGGVYKFDASVKGNGGGDGVSDYIANYGLAIEDGAFAELLWESRHDGDKTMSREIIDGAPIYRGGYVTFSTGRSEGNAVIAVKDIKGNIVWSWHIWVCNDEITAHDHIDSEGKVAAVIMDRNLGALNNTPMDVGNRGMFYEWGRKDPFTPSRSPYHADTDGNNVPAYNEPNTAIGDGTGTAGQHSQFDPEPDDLPAIAVQRPRRLVLHGNRPEGHASGTVGSREDHFRPLPSGLQGPGTRSLGHSRRKQLDHQRRRSGGLRRNRRQRQMGLERLRRLRAPLEKHRRLLPDGRQHLLHGLHLGEHLQLHGRHGILLDRPGDSRRDEVIGLLRELQPQLVQLQARRARLFRTDTLHPGITLKTDRL